MKRTKKQVEDRMVELVGNDRFFGQCRTWADYEALAGVRDRNEFWAGKTEAQAKADMIKLIRWRVERGEL